MAVSILSSGNSGLLFEAEATSYDHEITVQAGGSLYVATHVQPKAVTSVFWNTSEELQLVGSEISSTSPSVVKVYWHRLLSPTATTANITVNLSGSLTAVVITFLVLGNVNLADPEGLFQSDQSAGNVGKASLNLSIPVGGLGLIAFNREPASGTITFTPDDTETVITNEQNAAMDAWAAYDTVDPLGLSWPASALDWVIGGFAVNPAEVSDLTPAEQSEGAIASSRRRRR